MGRGTKKPVPVYVIDLEGGMLKLPENYLAMGRSLQLNDFPKWADDAPQAQATNHSCRIRPSPAPADFWG